MCSNLLPVLVAEHFNSVSHLRVWTEIDYYFHFSVSLEAFFQEMNPQTSFILAFLKKIPCNILLNWVLILIFSNNVK